MARSLVIFVVAAVVFTVFSIIDCAVQPATRHRGVSKGAWIVITCVPVIGGLLWFIIGRSRGTAAAGGGVVAPDDDPAFLSRVDAEADERIRQLEEELARLEDEDDAPQSGSATEDGAPGRRPDNGDEPSGSPRN